MGIIVAYSKKNKAKIKIISNTLNSLKLLVAISKLLAARISEEKKISIKDAENFVVECIKDGVKTIRD